MPNPKKRTPDNAAPSTGRPTLEQLGEQKQLDFELDFFAAVLAELPGYIDVLRAHANNLTLKGRYEEVQLEVDRKSTRLNSSHRCISYAVFCLKKKKSNTS